MLESIHVGMTGLLGYSQGLRVIANNTANINTPGYKSSSLQFADLFYSTSAGGPGGNSSQMGYGLGTAGTSLNFKQGDLRQTGNALDMAVDGQGLFTLKDEAGNIHYSRAGQFEFNAVGVLVNRADGAKVMGRDAFGNQTELAIAGQRTAAGKATANVKFSGNLSSTVTEQVVGSVKVIDGAGGEHILSVKFTNTGATTAGSWQVDLMEGTTVVGTGQIIFSDGRPVPANATVPVTYTPAGMAAIPLMLDFSADVTSFASGNLSTLGMASQDGYGPGTLSNVSFDAQGVMVLAYSNGQTVKGSKLLLGRFDSLEAVTSVGDNQFDATDSNAWHAGVAGDGAFGSIRAGMVEISNVNLSQEFSDLVVMQRGYQASSQVISTANEMLQELFSMKGK